MSKGIIRLGVQKIIEEAPVSLWDKFVFDATWMEYRMQAANFNQQSRATLFTTIVRENPGAKKLHDAVSTAAIGYIRQLQDIIPGLVNAHGKNNNTDLKILSSILSSRIWWIVHCIKWKLFLSQNR